MSKPVDIKDVISKVYDDVFADFYTDDREYKERIARFQEATNQLLTWAEETVKFVEASVDDELILCGLCSKVLHFADSYSPGDDAICASCDTEVTGRVHD